MIITIAHHLDDIRDEITAVHGDHVVVLSPDVTESLGYAKVHTCNPSARFGGVAVVKGVRAMGGVPDPVQIVVAERKTCPTGAKLLVRPSQLPVIVRVDSLTGTAVVLRYVSPSEPQATMGEEATTDVLGLADQPDHGEASDGAPGGTSDGGGDADDSEAATA